MTASDFKHTIQVLNDFGNALVANYKSELEAEQINNGELYKTIKYNVSTGNSGWVVSISLADYWKYVEYGRRPGKMPPLPAIENWIRVKQIIPHSMTLKSGKTIVPSIPQLSFLIARKIGRDGIPARPLFQKSFDKAKREFLQRIQEAVVQDIKESLEF